MIQPLAIIVQPFLTVNELEPQHTAVRRIHDNHHTEVPAPVCRVHENHNLTSLKVDLPGSHPLQPALYGGDRNVELPGQVGHSETPRRVGAHHISSRRPATAAEIPVAALTEPILAAVFYALADDRTAATFRALFLPFFMIIIL